MTVTLPYANQTWSKHRILVKDSWNGGSGNWTMLPMWSKDSAKVGYEVLSYNRVCLPAVGEAKIRFRFGKIDGRWVGPSDAPKGPWSIANDSITVPNLRKKEIRIQAGEVVTPGQDPYVWRTVWWGQCEYQEMDAWGGSAFPAGDILYHCSDALFRTKRWLINRHFFYITDGTHSVSSQTRAEGHPGYNALDHNGIKRGNKETSGVTFDPTSTPGKSDGDTLHNVYCHCWPGAGNIWTDREAIEHAMNVARPKGEPVFLLGSAGAISYYTLASGNSWDVKEDESSWDFLTKVCRRQRGLGVAFLDWSDDSGAPLGPLSPFIHVMPQTKNDITIRDVVSTQPEASKWPIITLQGSDSFGSSATPDLIGDHRLVEGSFTLGDRDQHRVDYLESVGEQIEVLVTLSGYDSAVNGGEEKTLDRRWIQAQADAFAALDPQLRVDDVWRPVYQLYGIPRAWKGKVADHNNGVSIAAHRADYRCNDDGSVSAPGQANSGLASNVWDTSPPLIEVLPDLPLLEGYDYTTYPAVRKDGQVETGLPPRRPPIVLVRLGDDRYHTGEWSVPPLTINVSKDGIMIHAPDDLSERGAYRTVGNLSVASLGSFFNFEQIGCTVGLRLPHRARFATYGNDDTGNAIAPSAAKRRLRITHSGLHLWLASAGAIWDIDAARLNPQGIPGKRSAAGGSTDSPGILRDDRGALQVRHALACEWYLRPRRTATWALRANGFLGTFNTVTDTASQQTTTVNYPTLGQVVTTITASGQVNTVNTPITSIAYDNVDGITTWTTDWMQLDFMDKAQ